MNDIRKTIVQKNNTCVSFQQGRNYLGINQCVGTITPGGSGHAHSENFDILYCHSCILGDFKAYFEGNNFIFCKL